MNAPPTISFPIGDRPAVRRMLQICVDRSWCKLFAALRGTCWEFLTEANLLLPVISERCPHKLGCQKKPECRCDCESMQKHRVRTAVRQWHCKGHGSEACLATYWVNDYEKYSADVCRECFMDHWRGTGVRPPRFCLLGEVDVFDQEFGGE